MQKYICIHGHFYQPPRENAWLEEIEIQESAFPYHDWNERITEECYGPNAVSRILNEHGRIIDIANNYARMSFNFGPTLLSWLEQKRPKVFNLILEADQLSQQLFNGHGSAMAQVYNHIIMPLANQRDKETQVIWGLHDFERCFRRPAEGIWLAETAVDLATLEILAANGIRYTVLAPSQAKRFRKMGQESWVDGIDPKRPYRCRLPGGKEIVLFFYDGPLSQAVAFGGLLKDGERFAHALSGAFEAEGPQSQLVHIATDGETFGHHHRHGDMALAYCLRYIETHQLARLTNYSEYLSLVEVEDEVEIHENSSWSCVHGVERWRSDCGCNTGLNPGWNQQWRQPLRQALNWLGDRCAEIYELEMRRFHPRPWDLRNAYIEVPLQRERDNAHDFIRKYIPGNLNENQKTSIILMLEMQRQALYMFTSCAWFFDEISGIETIQILQYACRAIQLAEKLSGEQLEVHFMKLLELAPSNNPEFNNGREIYETQVLPSRLDLIKVGMHFAVASVFNEKPSELEVLNYHCISEEFERYNAGAQKLAFGRTKIRSKITLSKAHISFVILYLGQHHVIGQAFDELSLNEYREFTGKLKHAFEHSNLSEVIGALQRHPHQNSFSFFNMFRDEQIKVLQHVLDDSMDFASGSYKRINDRNYHLLNVMRNSHLQVPKLLKHNLEMVLNHEILSLFDDSTTLITMRKLKVRVEEMKKWGFRIKGEEYDFKCEVKLRKLAETLPDSSQKEEIIANIQEALLNVREIGIDPDLNEVQEIVFNLLRKTNVNALQNNGGKALVEFGKFLNLDVDHVMHQREIAS